MHRGWSAWEFNIEKEIVSKEGNGEVVDGRGKCT